MASEIDSGVSGDDVATPEIKYRQSPDLDAASPALGLDSPSAFLDPPASSGNVIDAEPTLGLTSSEDNLPKVSSYREDEIIVYVNARNNLLFKWLPKRKAKWAQYQVLLSRSYPICMTIAGFLFLIVGATVERTTYGAGLFQIIGYLVGCFVSITYLLGGNLDIIRLAVTDFDFVFKVFNFLVLRISLFVIQLDEENGHIRWWMILIPLFTWPIWFLCFLIDALPTANFRVKAGLLCLVALYCFYSAANIYVNYKEVIWQPIPNFSPEIDWRATCLSSFTNLAIFTLKPLASLVKAKYIFLRNDWKLQQIAETEKNESTSSKHHPPPPGTTPGKNPYSSDDKPPSDVENKHNIDKNNEAARKGPKTVVFSPRRGTGANVAAPGHPAAPDAAALEQIDQNETSTQRRRRGLYTSQELREVDVPAVTVFKKPFFRWSHMSYGRMERARKRRQKSKKMKRRAKTKDEANLGQVAEDQQNKRVDTPVQEDVKKFDGNVTDASDAVDALEVSDVVGVVDVVHAASKNSHEPQSADVPVEDPVKVPVESVGEDKVVVEMNEEPNDKDLGNVGADVEPVHVAKSADSVEKESEKKVVKEKNDVEIGGTDVKGSLYAE